MNNDNFHYDAIQPSMVIDEVSAIEYYIGTSDNGIDLGKPTWRIKRIWKVNTIWKFGYPNGSQNFEFIWDNRFDYIYK